MGQFLWGLLAGASLCLAVLGPLVIWNYRRLERLQRRTRRSERLVELGTLTAGLAHEIKNPLSTIQLNLQLLREDLLPESPAYEKLVSRLSTVQKETTRLRDILDEFLRFAGKLEIDKKPIDVNRLIEELVDFFTPQAQLHRVQLRINPANQPMTVLLDERLIKQAMLNLMLNAVQAMPPDGGEIILSIRRDPNEAVIEIADSGAGIATEAISRVFDAYYSTKKSGVGLGLPITRRIIEEHGGSLTVSSEVGKGSTFTIRLPVSS